MAKKTSGKMTLLQKGILIGGGSVLLLTSVVGAIAKNVVSKPDINKISQELGTQEKTITGVLSREPGSANDKDKYVITLTGGTKYILIGLKQAYDVKGQQENDTDNGRFQNVKGNNKKTNPERPASKNDSDDRQSFEGYVGKTVTLTGFVVPVDNSDNSNKPDEMPEKAKNNGNLNGKRVSPKPTASPKNGGLFYDRFVVKSVVSVQ